MVGKIGHGCMTMNVGCLSHHKMLVRYTVSEIAIQSTLGSLCFLHISYEPPHRPVYSLQFSTLSQNRLRFLRHFIMALIRMPFLACLLYIATWLIGSVSSAPAAGSCDATTRTNAVRQVVKAHTTGTAADANAIPLDPNCQIYTYVGLLSPNDVVNL